MLGLRFLKKLGILASQDPPRPTEGQEIELTCGDLHSITDGSFGIAQAVTTRSGSKYDLKPKVLAKSTNPYMIPLGFTKDGGLIGCIINGRAGQDPEEGFTTSPVQTVQMSHGWNVQGIEPSIYLGKPSLKGIVHLRT